MRCSTLSTRAASVSSLSSVSHADRALHDDRPGIHFRHHEMHGGAVKFGAGFERALVGIEALERRQQGRVDVEHAATAIF